MNRQNTPFQSTQGRLGLIFIALSFGVILLVFAYFYNVLQPRLQQEAQSQAHMLTQSLSHGLTSQMVLHDAFLLQKEIGKILLYNDATYNRPFINGIKIEFNPEFFPDHNRALVRGEINCSDCFKVVTPLYDQKTLLLLGTLTFYVNPENYQLLVKEIVNSGIKHYVKKNN